MRTNLSAGTALSTILAGLVAGPALADMPKDKDTIQVVGKETTAGPSATATALRAPQDDALYRQIEQNRVQTLILAQAIGEFCSENDTGLESCRLFNRLSASGALDVSTLAFAETEPATAPPIKTTKPETAGTTGGLAGPLVANASADCAVGSTPDATQCGIGADANADKATAIGADSVTSGSSATAVGYSSQAGTGAVAIGRSADASGLTATALGYHASATGDHATAIGRSADASGTQSIAQGCEATASGDGAIAIGVSEDCDTMDSAVGASAISDGAIALGENTVAGDDTADIDAVAIGRGASVTAANAVAVGAGSVADEAGTVSVGSSGNERQIVNVADGDLASGSTDAVNGGQLFATNESVAANTAELDYFEVKSTGTAASATGTDSIAIGEASTATDFHAVALGRGADATGSSSLAVGSAAWASDSNATAIGASASATGISSTALGGRRPPPGTEPPR